jgi:salicylate hydroxylase
MLDRLGILGEVSRCAVRPKFLVMRDARSARCITSLDLGAAFMRHFSYPYLVMHRGDLLEAELRAARSNRHITLESNREVVSIEDAGDRVRVVCGDGSVHEGVAVVGADGLRSVTRRVVHDDGDPLCAEAVAYRATVPFERLPYDVDLDKMTIWVGPDLHFVQYVVRTGQLLNQVAVFRSRSSAQATIIWRIGEPLRSWTSTSRASVLKCEAGSARSIAIDGGPCSIVYRSHRGPEIA